MKILFDHCTPRKLRQFLKGHNVTTAEQHGWAELENGNLLDAADEHEFDIFITNDKKMAREQNFRNRRFGTIVIEGENWEQIRHHIPAVQQAIDRVQPGKKTHVEIPDPEPPANDVTFERHEDGFNVSWTDPKTGKTKTLKSAKSVDAGAAWLAAHKVISEEKIPDLKREVLESLERERERKRQR